MTEPYRIVMPVAAEVADDPGLFAQVQEIMADLWANRCQGDGGVPVGTPTVESEDNPHYREVIGRHDDGRPIVDDAKVLLVATGRADRALTSS